MLGSRDWGCESMDSNSLCMNKWNVAENSLLNNHCSSDNTFLINFQVEPQTLALCTSENVNIFKIDNDYEQSSSFQICRYVSSVTNKQCLSIPSLDLPIITLIPTTKNSLSKILELIERNLHYQLSRLQQQDSLDSVPRDVHRQYIQFEVINHALTNWGYYTFATYDQSSGVLVKIDSGDVVTIKNCIVNNKGEGYLTIECSRYHFQPYESATTEVPLGKGFKLNLFCLILHATEVTFWPCSERVLLQSVHKMKKDVNPYLTDYDKKNIEKDYSQYVPQNYESFSLYWNLLTGIELSTTDTLLAHIKTESGQRAVPMKAICSGVMEQQSKIKQLAPVIANDFVKYMKTVTFLSNVKLHSHESLKSSDVVQFKSAKFAIPLAKKSNQNNSSTSKDMINTTKPSLPTVKAGNNDFDDELFFGDTVELLPSVDKKTSAKKRKKM